MTSSNLGIEVDQTVDQNSGPMIIDLAMGSVIEEFNERNPRQVGEDLDLEHERTVEMVQPATFIYWIWWMIGLFFLEGSV